MSKLIKCKSCGADIASNAKTCPSCGAKNKKPLYKKWWVWAIAVVIVIGVAGGKGNNSSQNNVQNSNSNVSQNDNVVQSDTKTQTTPDDTVYKIGDTVTCGKWEYIVNKVSDKKTIGTNPYFKLDTQNNFVVVDRTVKNIGDTAQTIDTTMFKLYDSNGAAYTADGTADLYVNDNKKFFLESVNPNISFSGSIVFETPTTSAETPFTLELSGSMFSVKSEKIQLY